MLPGCANLFVCSVPEWHGEGIGMWVGNDGAVNVEVNWDDPWVIFDEPLAARVRALKPEAVEDLESSLMERLVDLADEVQGAFAKGEYSSAEESEFVYAEFPRQIVLIDIPSDPNVVQLLLGQVDRQPLRWRADVMQTVVMAIMELVE